MSLVKLELAQLKRSTLMRTIIAFFAVLVVYSLALGIAAQNRWAEAVRENRADTEQLLAREQENVRLQRQEGFNPPGAPAAQRMDASLPPAPGTVVAIGDSALRPLTATVTTSSRADTMFKNTETASPLSASLGSLDLTWIAIALLPLLVIALLHDVIAGDRDAGRFGLLRAQSRSLSSLVWRRMGLRLCLPLLLLTAATIVASWLGLPLAVAVMWLLIAGLYLLAWALLATWISLLARSAQAATATLLIVWLAFVVIAPAALNLVVERAAGAPSRMAQVIAMREVQLDLQSRTDQLLDRYFMDHPELAGVSRSGFARASFVSQRETEALLTPLMKRFKQVRQEQQSLSARLSALSPPMLVNSSLMHLAGTDGARHDAFVEQALGFAAAWREHLRQPLFMDKQLSVEELAALPRFEFREPGTRANTIATVSYLLIVCAVLAGLILRKLHAPELR